MEKVEPLGRGEVSGRAPRHRCIMMVGFLAFALNSCTDHTTQTVADPAQVLPQFEVSLPQDITLQCLSSPKFGGVKQT